MPRILPLGSVTVPLRLFSPAVLSVRQPLPTLLSPTPRCSSSIIYVPAQSQPLRHTRPAHTMALPTDKHTGKDPNAHPAVKFQSPITDYLVSLVTENSKDNPGANASYIPELKNANSDHIGACIATVDGYVYGHGSTEVEFSIQSVSKPFVYALAIKEHGLDWVLKRVDVEPSGEAFNELSLDGEQLPKNPMINVGAMTTHSLIGEGKLTVDERFERIRKFLSEFAGRELGVDDGSYNSEISTAFRNFSIAYMLKNYGTVKGNPDDIVRGYTRQCAIQLTARDLALMGATFANGGKQPVTGKQVITPAIVRQVLSVMGTCGMYNEAGHWACEVGFPSKSGVSGCILGVLPGNMGIASFSPRLDAAGNSVRGVRMFRQITKDFTLHMMTPPPPARTVIKQDQLIQSANGDKVALCALMGTVNFTATERILRLLQSRTAKSEHVITGLVIDLSRVDEIHPVAVTIIRKGLNRLRVAAHRVIVVDPEGLLGTKPGHKLIPEEHGADEVLADVNKFESWKKIPIAPEMLVLD